jgi:predicted amidohydrolase YtcJ
MSDETIFIGTVITMNAEQPRARALLARDGHVAAVGDEQQVRATAAADAAVIELGDRALIPGFVEAHGHPTDSALVLSDYMIDIRPVTIATADAVMQAIRDGIAARPNGAYFNGWDALLQKGLSEPTIGMLDQLAPDTPVVIAHNSGHVAYFNTAAARAAGIDKHSKDPVGSRWEKDERGELSGKGFEIGTLFALLRPLMTHVQSHAPSLLAAYLAKLNAVGITTVSDMSWDHAKAPVLDALRRSGPTARLRLYEMSRPGFSASVPLVNGDDLIRQVGVKTWADGSPWVGNILLSFPYLDTPATRGIGIPPGSKGSANYSREQLDGIVDQYFPQGWQLACHAHGDRAIDLVLDCWESMLERSPRVDHRLRLEHVGAMTPAQFQRAAALGVTASFLIDHVYYWGDTLVDDLFGVEHGSAWANARAAIDAGMRISLHNDGTVTPAEPLRNMGVATTRRSRSGRVLHADEAITVDEALRAQTIDAAWQVQADDIVGSLEVGKYADLVVLSADPYTVEPSALPGLTVDATYLAGRQVYERSATRSG